MRGFQPPHMRSKDHNYANGGMVRGPGTGTSDDIETVVPEGTYIMPADSTKAVGAGDLAGMGARGFSPRRGVPVNLSNGEFKMPPDQVHAIGVQALDRIKGATHKPVGFAPGAKAAQEYGEPRTFFADGGVVEDEERKRRMVSPSNIYPQASPSAGRSPYAEQATPGAPAAAVPRGLPPRTAGPSELFMQDRAQEMKSQTESGQYAQAAGTAARTAVQGLGMYGLEAADKLSEPVVRTARGFAAGLFGSADTDPAPAPSAPASTPPGNVAQPVRGFDPTRAEASRRTVTQQTPFAASWPSTQTEGGAGELRPGVFEHGRGQFSDQRTGMGFTPGFTGKPSTQNLAAGDNLTRGFQPGGRPAEVPSSVVGFPAGAAAAPVARHSGNDWQARNELRNAQVSASSITNNGGRSDRHKGVSPAAAYAGALANADIAARAAQPGMDTEAMRQTASLTREGMQQTGENQRNAARNAIDGQRVAIDGQRVEAQRRSVDSQVEAQSYANRSAAQQEQLRGVLADPTASVEQRAQAQQALRSIAGQGQNDWKVQVTPAAKNPDGSTSEGSVIRYNQSTGQVEKVDVGKGGGTASPDALSNPKTRPVGTVSTMNGKSATWDGIKWVPQA